MAVSHIPSKLSEIRLIILALLNAHKNDAGGNRNQLKWKGSLWLVDYALYVSEQCQRLPVLRKIAK